MANLTPFSKLDETFDRASELKAFDQTKAGVKGLVDSGVAEIPGIFYYPHKERSNSDKISVSNEPHLGVPVVDLEDIDKDPFKRRQAVDKIREASESWGFFQVLNHGFPVSVQEEIINGTRQFFEQDTEVKKQYYTRDNTKPFVYHSNFDLFSAPTANWRDTVFIQMAPNSPNPEDFPQVCRDILIEYSKQIEKVGELIFELLSEALGLKSTHLLELDCTEGHAIRCHYYPSCPQPEFTIGTTQHSDSSFITVLLQDHIGGLQVLHHNKWVDVPPLPGAFTINVGSLLQASFYYYNALISNDKFVSSVHRVVANHEGPRISVASAFSTGTIPTSKVYGPIKQLLSQQNPPKYRQITVREYRIYFANKGLDGTDALAHFRL
ncbi:1-aminocyclopropane-1-carboxylate oxidase-like protein 1-like [Cucumis melo var. makuwa]|uniref:1-aminocyclopropane-1-carboxylate oxidase-like protein 1-like n=1 Tax=Cucumis melo var. makuwa TaxID=1194695 RepID=A0A5D3CZG5_CUCMM|nr:1-aminocyclopropane-1-carboxylate oxidase-like protein 1-like [Cucumis melo var. makuwa]TYK17293.1 1-aminocyclopropane-1-carboxylate oxidase-like protein 1-like [Cucumis melo var. makuwa]